MTLFRPSEIEILLQLVKDARTEKLQDTTLPSQVRTEYGTLYRKMKEVHERLNTIKPLSERLKEEPKDETEETDAV